MTPCSGIRCNPELGDKQAVCCSACPLLRGTSLAALDFSIAEFGGRQIAQVVLWPAHMAFTMYRTIPGPFTARRIVDAILAMASEDWECQLTGLDVSAFRVPGLLTEGIAGFLPPIHYYIRGLGLDP